MTIIQRMSGGALIGNDGENHPAYIRCYHQKNGESLPCTCQREEQNDGKKVVYTLCQEDQRLEKLGQLFIDAETFDLQSWLLRMEDGRDIPNPFSPFGQAILRGMVEDRLEGIEEEEEKEATI